MLRRIGHFLYLYRIGYVLAKYDALFFLSGKKRPFILRLASLMAPIKCKKGRDGERLCLALQQLGPIFIKAGQALATRADLIGEQVARDLSKLQDDLPAFSFEQAKASVEAEFGKPLDELFADFDESPVAAASIAQVHFAVDLAGNEVAVKILRPKIEATFARDIGLLYGVADLVRRYLPKYKRLKLHAAVRELEKTVKTEMDLRLEAAAACEFADNFAGDDSFNVPAIDWQLTSQRVMTMERIEGIRIDQTQELVAAGHDVDDLMQKCATVSFLQIYRDGVFHADMHPGNLFVAQDGTLIAVDFGIIGRLDEATRMYLARLLYAFLNKDYQTVGDLHFDMGFLNENQDRGLFAQACRAVIEPIFEKNQSDISVARMMGQMFKMFDDFEMEVQPQLLLLQKTLVLAEGVGRRLNPEANFWDLSRPLMETWIAEHMGPAGMARRAKSELAKLPERLKRIGEAIDHLPMVMTENGVRLHGDTISTFVAAQKTQNRISLWGIGLLSVAVSALTVWLLRGLL